MCLVKKRKQRLNLHKRRYGSYGSIRFNYDGIRRSNQQKYHPFSISNRTNPLSIRPFDNSRRVDSSKYKPFSTSKYDGGKIFDKEKIKKYIPSLPNVKKVIDSEDLQSKVKGVIDVVDNFIEEKKPVTIIKDFIKDKFWEMTDGKSLFDPSARLDVSLIRGIVDGYKKYGSRYFTDIAKAFGVSSIFNIKEFKEFNEAIKGNNLYKYLEKRYKQGDLFEKNTALELIKMAIQNRPEIVDKYISTIFGEKELALYYLTHPEDINLTLPVLYKGKVIRVNGNCFKTTPEGEKCLDSSIVDQMSGVLAPLAIQKYLDAIKPISDIVVDKLNDLTNQHKLMDDDLDQLNFSQQYIRSVLPPELWKRIEDVAFEPNVMRRYESLQYIPVPEAISTHSSDDYYHKIHIGARTNRSDNKGTIFKPSDFERRGLHQYLYKQPHFNKVQSGQDRFEVMKNVYKQLKQWGISDKRADYEKVLLRVSPDDDKINHFKTINGKIKFYNK
ncbi:hypothetical protein CL6EHI_062330 [Entamoeba histolytica]|uniref:Uncharacterized protein n=2 Tax=Entamoeba histolytica TaxID=5759 RepID=C4M8J3_ENTH1|nr:hypothetical protein EHI_062330 [Entamoeba histolytica HM-1:IMSS]EAL44804.1 hypothetical protein EHI_062330 [Entamoeba histolytica HM-1:IMSS]GAT97927.1 hypothetical protein CL6EHI_062330 [Entamoeba histolytica]|eukprot:XP_650190.1 hypothetical protein EHI_062330 [Entamoeba histolytica HM-1:IMSS]